MRSPFSAPSASVISASSISCITARTISRSPSRLLAKSSLTLAIAGLISRFHLCSERMLAVIPSLR